MRWSVHGKHDMPRELDEHTWMQNYRESGRRKMDTRSKQILKLKKAANQMGKLGPNEAQDHASPDLGEYKPILSRYACCRL